MPVRKTWLSMVLVAALTIPWLGHDPHSSVYIPASLDLLTLNARDIAELLGNNTITSVQLTKEYLRRIELDDRSGLRLRTMLELTPFSKLIDIANERDTERQNGIIRSPLHGIPLIIKANMATDPSLGMSTSSGAIALQNATATHDSYIISKARDAGMIIIGKSNLAELNGFKDNSLSPGWSSLGGETISPYDLQHPCGSSAGSAAAIAAGFGPLALGTETQGSISCPASFTALYGLKVSTGLLSRSGLLPSSTSFDSPGIFAKSAWDIAALLSQFDGVDPEDPITSESQDFLVNFEESLETNWSNFRIGVADKEWFWSILPGFEGDKEDVDDEKKMFSVGLEAVKDMELRGATIVSDAKIRTANLSVGHAANLMGKIIRHEMGPGLAQYLTNFEGTPVRSLEDLVKFNRNHSKFSNSHDDHRQGYLEAALNQNMSVEEYHAVLMEARRIAVEDGIVETLDSQNLDVLVLPAWTDMSIYAAWARLSPQ